MVDFNPPVKGATVALPAPPTPARFRPRTRRVRPSKLGLLPVSLISTNAPVKVRHPSITRGMLIFQSTHREGYDNIYNLIVHPTVFQPRTREGAADLDLDDRVYRISIHRGCDRESGDHGDRLVLFQSTHREVRRQPARCGIYVQPRTREGATAIGLIAWQEKFQSTHREGATERGTITRCR